MEDNTITQEKVRELYQKLSNKQHFLIIFGTTKFHLASPETLKRMYDFLIKKVKD